MCGIPIAPSSSCPALSSCPRRPRRPLHPHHHCPHPHHQAKGGAARSRRFTRIPPLFHSGQRSVDKYLRPLSHTITATVPPLHAPRGPSSCNAADTFAPAENPPNIPSSAARRREHSTASWSFTYKEGESVHSVRTRVVRCYGVNEVRSKAARGGKNLY